MRILRRARVLGLAASLLAMVPLRPASYHVTWGHVYAGSWSGGTLAGSSKSPGSETERGTGPSCRSGPDPSSWPGERLSARLPWGSLAFRGRTGRRLWSSGKEASPAVRGETGPQARARERVSRSGALSRYAPA